MKVQVQLGDATIQISAANVRRDAENWLTAQVTLCWALAYGQPRPPRGEVTMSCGCWRDTDDDRAEWCAANEGANALAALASGRSTDGDSRGTFVRVALSDECEALGLAICSAIRAALAESEAR